MYFIDKLKSVLDSSVIIGWIENNQIDMLELHLGSTDLESTNNVVYDIFCVYCGLLLLFISMSGHLCLSVCSMAMLKWSKYYLVLELIRML